MKKELFSADEADPTSFGVATHLSSIDGYLIPYDSRVAATISRRISLSSFIFANFSWLRARSSAACRFCCTRYCEREKAEVGRGRELG